jgi:electron transport complex protein RnfB
MLILTAIIALGVLATLFGLLLGYANQRFHVEGDPLADQVEQQLPQTQCGQCGYPGCRPYAEAVAAGSAEINLCAPGGSTTLVALADLLGRQAPPPEGVQVKPKAVAWIDEQSCIGCTLCLQACPVDAILGAAKQLHTVISAQCTGCELCLEPCPVDCIQMRPIGVGLDSWKWPFPSGTSPAIARSAAA